MNSASKFFLPVMFLLLLVVSSATFTVNQTETVIITRFGKIDRVITQPGLSWKVPFVETINILDNRVMEWDGTPASMPTRDKAYIEVDAFGRWRISNPREYFESLRDERTAQSRLSSILGSETRTTIAKHDLIEIIRTTKDRKPVQDESLKSLGTDGTPQTTVLPPIKEGRVFLEKQILDEASKKLPGLGIELLDLRFKRVNYNPDVLQRIYARMISERQQIASRYRSEGEGSAARILGDKEKDLNEIESEAYKKVQEIQGLADAEASRIYAEAYNKTPAAAEFYAFVKGLDTYRKTVGSDTTLILSTDSDIFGLLKRSAPKATAPRPGAASAAAATPVPAAPAVPSPPAEAPVTTPPQ